MSRSRRRVRVGGRLSFVSLPAGLAGMVLLAATGAALAAGGGGLRITWLGHSSFLITDGAFTVITDPFPNDLGYPPIRATADLVTVSHEHFDHNHVAAVGGRPRVIRGLAGRDRWNHVNESVGPFRLRAVPTYHDDQKGRERGLNSVFVFEGAGLRLAHLGDLGHLLSPETVAAIGPIDILLIPVGGRYTLDAPGAHRVVEQLAPRVVIPMHYRTRALGERLPIAPVDPFLEGQEHVRRVGGATVAVAPGNLPSEREIWVLEPAAGP